MRNQKGITLIALVITIIVLIILAAVSIAMLTGNSGTLTEADKINMELNAFKKDILADDKISYESFEQAKKSLGNGYEIKAGTDAESSETLTADSQEALDTALEGDTVLVISNGKISGEITLATGTVKEATASSVNN